MASTAQEAPRLYVSAPSDLDLRPLLDGLKRRGTQPYVLSDVALLGGEILESLRLAIQRADRVLIVLGDPRGPIPCSRPASRSRSENRCSSSPTQTGRPLGRARAKELLNRLSHSSAGEWPSTNVLIEAIESSGGVAVVNDDRSAGFDLGVWSDDLEAIGGNPLLVELKQTLRPGVVSQVLRALDAHPTARVALIVYREPGAGDPQPPRAELNAARFPVLIILLEELLRRMESASFAQVVRMERNRSVHGPGPS
jgi:hypothetical protein